eukprot:COSAG03_NODE_1566_length_3865_cov_5.286511_2_plen_84_part_00
MRSIESRPAEIALAHHTSISCRSTTSCDLSREWIRVDWLWARGSVEHRGLPHHTQHHPQTGRGRRGFAPLPKDRWGFASRERP